MEFKKWLAESEIQNLIDTPAEEVKRKYIEKYDGRTNPMWQRRVEMFRGMPAEEVKQHLIALEKSKTEFKCMDCGDNVIDKKEYQYMVRQPVWRQAVKFSVDPSPARDLLCVNCLEKRLGRQLDPADFTDAPINREAVNKSQKLRDRQGLSH